MKNRNRWLQIVGCLFMVLSVACTDTKEVVLPRDNSMLGMMGTQDVYARMGQPYLAACPIRLSEYAEDIRVVWSDAVGGNTTDEDERGDKVSYKTFIWNEKGEKKVTCEVRYSYGGETKELNQTMNVMVVPPVYGNCFLGDRFERIKELYPEMKLLHEYVPNIYVYNISSTEYIVFKFRQNSLYIIKEIKERVEAESNPYQYFMEWVGNVSDEYAKAMRFECLVKEWWNITDEDYAFVEEVNEGKVLSEADIAHLNSLLGEGIVEFRIQVIYDYSVYSNSEYYIVEKNDNVYCWTKLYKTYKAK